MSSPGMYANPVLHLDYSDPDIASFEGRFYLTASSFNCLPGLPILESADLVNWTIIGHALTYLPERAQESVSHGGGVWAPSIRVHNSKVYIYYSDPDHGIFGPQWQWQGHPMANWIVPAPRTATPGLCLSCVNSLDNDSPWNAPNVLLQKFPAERFCAKTICTLHSQSNGARAGMIVMGTIYSYCALLRENQELYLVIVAGDGPLNLTTRKALIGPLQSSTIHLECALSAGALYRWRYSLDGISYTNIGPPLFASPGMWIGAKIGIFAASPTQAEGYAAFPSFDLSIDN